MRTRRMISFCSKSLVTASSSSGSNGLVLTGRRVELFLELELELFLNCPLVVFRGMPCFFQRLTPPVTH